MSDETRVRLVTGGLKNGGQVVRHEGEGLLRIARPASEALNVSIIGLVEALLGPAVATKPPDGELPPSDGP